MFLTLNPALISKYPKSTEALVKWAKEKAIETAGVNTTEYTEQINQAINQEYAQALIQYTPRHLYDFFDAQNLLCSVHYTPDLNTWSYFIHPSPNVGGYAPTRQQAEIDLFNSAFVTLEEKL